MDRSVISRLLGSLLVLMTALGAAGCNQNIPVCPDTKLEAPTLGAPQDGTITNNLTPVLSWSYRNPNCRPESYRVSLSTVANQSQAWTGTTAGVSTTWSPQTPLLPGRMYSWSVWSLISPNIAVQSTNHIFFTGPMCDTASLHAPLLNTPIDGSVVDNLSPTMLWDYPDPCLPESYRIDYSTDITFANIALSSNTGDPATIWYTGAGLADCTTYFWRVAPINSATLGPYSGVSTFSTDREQECPPQAATMVRGVLWYDQCSLPLDTSPVPNPLPAGCVVDSYGVDADGIHKPAEPFMLNITVNIGPGDCPSGGTQSTVTALGGAYLFSGLAPGKYCLNVNAASFLGPAGTGHWTVIPSGHEGNTYRAITLGAGQVLASQDFAWYQYSGPTASPTPTLTPTPTTVPEFLFIPAMNVNCHTGPDLIFDTLDVAMKGKSYPIDGRNLDGTWLRIMLNSNNGCWVMTNTGTSSIDISAVRVLISPPTPTPTLVVDCASYTDEKSCEAQPVCQWKPSTLGTVVTYSCTSK